MNILRYIFQQNLFNYIILERVARIELARDPWQGPRLPLHHTRFFLFNNKIGDPGRIRTCDPQLRRLLLYPLSYEATLYILL